MFDPRICLLGGIRPEEAQRMAWKENVKMDTARLTSPPPWRKRRSPAYIQHAGPVDVVARVLPTGSAAHSCEFQETEGPSDQIAEIQMDSRRPTPHVRHFPLCLTQEFGPVAAHHGQFAWRDRAVLQRGYFGKVGSNLLDTHAHNRKKRRNQRTVERSSGLSGHCC